MSLRWRAMHAYRKTRRKGPAAVLSYLLGSVVRVVYRCWGVHLYKSCIIRVVIGSMREFYPRGLGTEPCCTVTYSITTSIFLRAFSPQACPRRGSVCKRATLRRLRNRWTRQSPSARRHGARAGRVLHGPSPNSLAAGSSWTKTAKARALGSDNQEAGVQPKR